VNFWERVDRSGDCWPWLGPLTADGYGKAVKDRKPVRAHRLAYELLKGPIPAGLTIDHLCRNRRCVNPDHMEPVTNRVNVLRGIGPTAVRARQTVCIRGHALDGIDHRGYRFCKECKRLRDNAAYHALREGGQSE
jgi:hypothetical protein